MPDAQPRKPSFVSSILERIKPGRYHSCFQLWGCTGEGRGCKRNKTRTHRKHCDDCVLIPRDEKGRPIMPTT